MKQRGEPLTRLVALDDLRALAEHPGPTFTAYLPLRPADEELAEATALRWRGLRDQAGAAGVPPELLDDVQEQLDDDAYREGAGLGIVAAEGSRPHLEELVAVPPELIRWQEAPALTPLIADRQRRQPIVVALVDRRGADFTTRTAGTIGPDDARSTSVDAATYPLRKVAPGGWSQRRFQQHAEETWHHNMTEVAEELVSLVAKHDARLVALGGEERALGLLLEQLPDAVRERIQPIAVTRATDGSIQHLDEELDRVLTAWVDSRLAETLAAFARELGQHDRAAQGAGDVGEALRAGRVAALIVPPWSTDAIDRAVADALATSADVHVIADLDDVPDHLGALLRW
jgi:hypothetical protein